MPKPLLKSMISPSLFGRTADLERLPQLVDAAVHRRGQTVLISGEAGIGKTRLVAEARKLAGEAGMQTLSGSCFELDALLPYAPILEMLRNWVAEQPEEQLSERLGPFAPEIARLLPELVNRLPALTPDPGLDPEQEKRRTFETLVQFLGKLADTRPLLLVYEDLHWSDDTSLEFLFHLVRRVKAKPVLLIMTYRSDEVTPGLSRFLSSLDREHLAEEISLQRLNESQIGEMVAAIFDLPQPARLEFIQPLYELTDGNPFFIEEILKSLVMSGDIFFEKGGWDRKPIHLLHIPRSIQIVVQERLNSLSAQGRDLVRLAAVAGRRFDFRLLQTALGVSEADLLPLLRELVAAQLVVEESQEVFTFRHALTRNAINATMLALERKPYHQKVGKALEHLYAGSLEMVTADLAEHFFQAGDWENALKYASQAAADAQRLYSPQAVIVQVTRALEAAEFFSASPPAWLYRARGQALEMSGEFDRARVDYETILERGESTGDQKLAWQSLLDLGLLWASRDYEQTGHFYQRAMALAREIEEPEVLAHTLNRVGNWRLNTGQIGEAVRFYQDALALFESSGDLPGTAETLELLGMASGQEGRVESIGYYNRAVDLFRKLGDRYGVAMSLGMRGFLSALFSPRNPDGLNKDQILRDVETSLQIARETGWRSGEAYILLQSCQVLELFGEYGTALRNAQEGARIATEIEHRQWMAAGQNLIGAIYLDLLDLDQAHQYLERGMVIGQEIGSLIWSQMGAALLAVTLCLQAGPGLTEASSVAKAILDRACPASAPQSFYEVMAACARVRVALTQGQPEQALELLDQLSASAPLLVQPLRWYPLSPMLLRAEALSQMGQDESAETLLRTEQEFIQAWGIRPLGWQVFLAQASIYNRNKRYPEAKAAFQSARDQLEALAGSISDEILKNGFLERASALIPPASARTARQTAKLEFGGLTERERQVAALIASGKSNHEIGAALSISERTTATHVGNILNKLTFSSRSQIAAWAVEHGIFSPDPK